MSTQGGQSEWRWTFRYDRNKKYGNHLGNATKTNTKDLENIATSVYVMNFPKTWEVRDLWKACQVFGRIVDVYIARKMSKLGRRFAFARFIRVCNVDSLISRMIASWTVVPQDNKKYSYVSLCKQQSDVKTIQKEKKKKVVYLEQSDMSSITDKGTILLGKVWMDFDNLNACLRFKQQKDMQFYFTKLRPLTKDFVVDDKVVWIRIDGLPILAWSVRAFRKIAEEWGEVMYMDDEGGGVGNGRICIKVKVGCKVEGELSVMVAGTCYNVWVKKIK
ncbi:RNA-directed DNA polymerase, eukaryota [Tanacetum coccineum]